MLHQRLLGVSTVLDPESGNADVDVGGILRRLLLFETYILKSNRLRELPAIVERLGFADSLALLESGALRIHLDATTTAQTGQAALVRSRTEKGALPLESYCFHTIRIKDRRDHISGCFRESIDPIPVSVKKQQKLKKAILDALETPPNGIEKSTIDQLRADLRAQNPALRIATANQLQGQLGIEADPNELLVRLHPLDKEDFEAESNLAAKFGLEAAQRHKVIERAALDLAGVNERLSEMSAFEALSGFRPNDVPIFEEKLSFVVDRLDPDKHEERARRVLQTTELPDFQEVGRDYQVDTRRFLEIRDSAECREFRAWLPSIDQASDEEIIERVSELRARIAGAVNSPTGRALRFLTSAGLGLIPGAGLVLGPGASALDTFVVDRIFKESAIVTFIGRMYPSLFDPDG
jgi:hypothetical protein